jgi:type IV secretory pathway VirB6-like protein
MSEACLNLYRSLQALLLDALTCYMDEYSAVVIHDAYDCIHALLVLDLMLSHAIFQVLPVANEAGWVLPHVNAPEPLRDSLLFLVQKEAAQRAFDLRVVVYLMLWQSAMRRHMHFYVCEHLVLVCHCKLFVCLTVSSLVYLVCVCSLVSMKCI